MRRLLVADYKQAALAIISIMPISIFTIWSDADWSRWKILMPLASPRPFLDFEYLTYNSYCYASQTVFNISSDACGRPFNYLILGRPFNYLILLLQASSYFGVNAYWTFPLGVLMQLSCLGVFFLLSYQAIKSVKKVYRATLFLACLQMYPSILFFMKRGNLDLLVFVLVIASLVLYQRIPLLSLFLLFLLSPLSIFGTFPFFVGSNQYRKISNYMLFFYHPGDTRFFNFRLGQRSFEKQIPRGYVIRSHITGNGLDFVLLEKVTANGENNE